MVLLVGDRLFLRFSKPFTMYTRPIGIYGLVEVEYGDRLDLGREDRSTDWNWAEMTDWNWVERIDRLQKLADCLSADVQLLIIVQRD